jgi:hypothetical protein
MTTLQAKKSPQINLDCVICGSSGINFLYNGRIYCRTHYQQIKEKEARGKPGVRSRPLAGPVLKAVTAGTRAKPGAAVARAAKPVRPALKILTGTRPPAVKTRPSAAEPAPPAGRKQERPAISGAKQKQITPAGIVRVISFPRELRPLIKKSVFVISRPAAGKTAAALPTEKRPETRRKGRVVVVKR